MDTRITYYSSSSYTRTHNVAKSKNNDKNGYTNIYIYICQYCG